MKITIADDDQAKIKKVLSFLTESCGFSRDDVTVAQSALDVRRHLMNETVDILLLDIMLPRMPEDMPSIDASIELLEELSDSNDYNRPKQVIGLTAYDNAIKEASPRFAERLWIVLYYDPANDEWQGPIRNSVAYLRASGERREAERYQTDLCIVTALQEPEMSAVYRLPWHWKDSEPVDDTQFMRRGNFAAGGKECSVVAAVSARTGMVSSALLSAKLI